MEHEYAQEGQLIFIEEGLKKRPHLCIKVYKNQAGVPYNWLVLPITSSSKVGNKNLFPIKHPKLKKESYVKLNNIKTINWKSGYETKNKINNEDLDQIKKKLCNTIKNGNS